MVLKCCTLADKLWVINALLHERNTNAMDAMGQSGYVPLMAHATVSPKVMVLTRNMPVVANLVARVQRRNHLNKVASMVGSFAKDID